MDDLTLRRQRKALSKELESQPKYETLQEAIDCTLEDCGSPEATEDVLTVFMVDSVQELQAQFNELQRALIQLKERL